MKSGIRPETLEKYKEVDRLKENGMPQLAALKKVGAAPSGYYAWRKVQSFEEPVITVHKSNEVDAPVSRKTQKNQSDFVIVTNAASLRSVLEALR